LNKKVSKDEFHTVYEKINSSLKEKNNYQIEFERLKKKIPSKNLRNINSQKTSLSDKIENSENLQYCFECKNSKDLKYCTQMIDLDINDCYDYDIWGENSSLIYEVHCS
jgi:hypothetical protein